MRKLSKIPAAWKTSSQTTTGDSPAGPRWGKSPPNPCVESKKFLKLNYEATKQEITN